MRSARTLAFLAFTAVFAVLAGFVFWGTWSLGFVPVMPDGGTTYPPDEIISPINHLLSTGKFIYGDLIAYFGVPYFWHELRFVVADYFAALALVYFLRGRGLSRLASYGAGLLLAFSGYWLTLFSAGHYGWFQWMTYGTFAFGLCDRAVRKGRLRHWLMLGAVVSWAGFNQQDIWLLFTIFTAGYFIWCCVRERRLPWQGALIALAAFILIGLPNFKETLLVTVASRKHQISSGATVTQKDASDADKRWEFITNWSMPIEDTLEFFNSRVHGDTSCPFVLSINRREGIRPYTGALGRSMTADRGNYRQHSLYVGWLTCLFALIGAVFGVRQKRGEVIFFIGAALVFYLLSLGRYCAPVYRIIFSLPAGDLIRCPVKWHHLTEFCLAVLAGYGLFAFEISRLMAVLKPRIRYAVLVVVVLIGVVDLAKAARIYCAPVDVRFAREHKASAQLSIITRDQFANPQIAEQARRGYIRSVASYMGHPDIFVVELLEPYQPTKRKPINKLACLLGLISILTTFGISGYALKKVIHR